MSSTQPPGVPLDPNSSLSQAVPSAATVPQSTPTAGGHPQLSEQQLWRLPPRTVPLHAPFVPSTSAPNGSTPSFTGYSATTEEILKRVSANAAARQGTPGWEAAREQVLKSMVTSDSITVTPPSALANKRGRGRGGAKAGTAAGTTRSENAATGTPATASTSSPATGRGRGGGRGRGRGGGRGGKRKREDSAEESENDSDISSSYTPLPTTTKSGRNVTKPTQFVPTLPSPSTAPKRKRTNRRATEASVCKTCQRGHSPNNNMIVFCDTCNTPYHQYCHDPPIDKEVVMVPDKEWHCALCQKLRDNAIERTEGLVHGGDMSLEEKRSYLSTLPQLRLVDLLLRASSIHPDLPLFPLNLRSRDQAAHDVEAMNAPGDATSDTPPDTIRVAMLPPQQPTTTNNAATTPQSSSSYLPPNPPQPLHNLAVPQSQPPAPQTQHPPPSHQPLSLPRHQPRPAPAPPSPSPEPEHDPDAYDGYDTDPPAHYPKPGNGLARPLRPESEDLQWLVDDNFEVFSHMYKSGDGGDGGDAVGGAAEAGGVSDGLNGFGGVGAEGMDLSGGVGGA